MREIAGHIIGAVGVILFFISYQVKDKKNLLLLQTVATSLICIQYLLIGAYSGFALNIVCAFRNICLFFRDKHENNGIAVPVLLALLMPVASIFSWEGPVSLFIIAGLMINTVCMGVCNAQQLRKSIILTSSLIIVYNLIRYSYAGIVNESISIASAIIGVIRFRETMNKPQL